MANLKLVHSICIVLFLASQAASLPHRSLEERGSRSPKYRNQIVSSRAGKFYKLSILTFISFFPPSFNHFRSSAKYSTTALSRPKWANGSLYVRLELRRGWWNPPGHVCRSILFWILLPNARRFKFRRTGSQTSRPIFRTK